MVLFVCSLNNSWSLPCLFCDLRHRHEIYIKSFFFFFNNFFISLRKILEHVKESYINKGTKGNIGVLCHLEEMWQKEVKCGHWRRGVRIFGFTITWLNIPQVTKRVVRVLVLKYKKREKGFGFTWIWALWVLFITMPRDKSSKLGIPYFIFPTFPFSHLFP